MGRAITRTGFTQNEQMRRFAYRSAYQLSFLFGLSMATYNSTARLCGLTENGLSWKYQHNSIKKYDFTSQYEQGTIWKYLR
jgi:hypothetical protein